MEQLSPEDREILAKTKFKQWFDECWNETFGGAFDKRLIEVHEAAGTSSTTAVTSSGKTAEQSTGASKRRSLFEVAFSDVFGM